MNPKPYVEFRTTKGTVVNHYIDDSPFDVGTVKEIRVVIPPAPETAPERTWADTLDDIRRRMREDGDNRSESIMDIVRAIMDVVSE